MYIRSKTLLCLRRSYIIYVNLKSKLDRRDVSMVNSFGCSSTGTELVPSTHVVANNHIYL